jgi:GT2 family glycosyltransferase
MEDIEQKQNQPPSAETEKPSNESDVRTSPEQIRTDRINSIDQQLSNFNHSEKSEEEIAEIQKAREEEYQTELSKLETGLGQPLSEESKQKIHQNMVDSAIERAQNENENYDRLVSEKKILEYLNSALKGEKPESFIARPMSQDCKVAIMIPAYNENASNILRSLSSLAEQEEVDPNLFEVDLVVNNRKVDAEQNTPAFLANQESIRLIKYINGESREIPEGLTTEQIEQVEKIRKAEIKINVIDKSSVNTSDEENNVGVARDRAGAEIIDRFMKSSGNTEGAIAITDCDCIFSRNFIKSLIASFEEHKINGVSGNLEFEIDSSLPNQELIKKAFDIYMGKDGPKKDYSGEPNFKIQKEGALQAGANMTVTAKAWAMVNGMPRIAGGEDIRFGKNIEDLRGQVAKNYDYTITSLIRVSERTGLQGNGRIVKKIKESVDDFVAGKTDRIVVEDREMVDKFFNGVLRANESKALKGKLFLDLMKECNFKQNNIPESEYDELASEINTELEKPKSEQELKKIEKLILEKIYPYYPERDVTDRIIKKES